MNPELWHRVDDLFQSVLDCEPDHRGTFLNQACAGDRALRQEIESLIASYQEAERFTGGAALEDAARLLAMKQRESMVGCLIGSYKVIREIGRGGMGAVYLAARADEQYRKQVAIKIIKRGLDTDFIIDRFLSERQILADLDHPNITRLLEGGITQEGLPYFVMEYVEGKPINQYSDEQKLTTSERLKLFRVVCSAIHYAHQNLVIHRDIKPGNILVTADGVPKLLDFGIAKLLNPDPSSQTIDKTATVMRLMTPEYASPEQLRGEKITTATDIYSLGGLLYRLLTGHRPYRVKTGLAKELERAICEEEPEKPSAAISRIEEAPSAEGRTPITPESVSRVRDGEAQTLRRKLSGDLDNIMLMAMRREPQRRYKSVEQFSEDIRRHLAGLPVVAHKDTVAYRSAKFIKRHKAGVAAAALVTVTLISGVALTIHEKHKAQRRFNEVRELANSFMFEVNGAIEHLPGSTPARVLLIKRALKYLDSLAQEAGDDDSLQIELARAYLNVGDIQGRPYRPNIGDTTAALASYRKAQALLEALSRTDPQNLDVRFNLSLAYQDVGRLQMRRQDLDRALESEHLAVEGSEQLIAADPENAQYRKLLADNYLNLGMAMYGDDSSQSTENVRQTLDILGRALSIHEALAAANPADGSYRWAVGDDYEFIGYVLRRIGDLTGDREHYRQALENHRKELAINEALSASDPSNSFYRRILSDALMDVGQSLLKLGEAAQALECFRQRLSVCETIAASDPTNVEAKRELASGYQFVGRALSDVGDLARALEQSHKALASFEALLNADPINTDNRFSLVAAQDQIGNILNKMGNMTGALERYKNALGILKTWSAQRPTSTAVCRLMALEYTNIGHVYTEIAIEAKRTTDENQEAWRKARDSYQLGSDIWQKMREQNQLVAADVYNLEQANNETARCETALKK